MSAQVVKVPYLEVVCKHCGSKRVIRYGHFHGIQRFCCKDCKRKFADNDALPNMQTPVDQVGAAIGMFYEGQSLNSVRRLLTQIYNSYPSDSTVYRWITRFTREGLLRTKGQALPTLGDVWVADETMLDVAGRKVWFYDIIDEKTRFLLASHIARSRTMKDTVAVMNEAYTRAGKAPKRILSDRMSAYPDAIERVFGADTTHIQSKPFSDTDSTNAIERFHGSLKDRTKVMRGLKDMRTAKLITDGWLLHYNYLRPHESLNDKTPAEMAGARLPYRNWQDIVSKQKRPNPKQATATSAVPIPIIAKGYLPELRFQPRRRIIHRPQSLRKRRTSWKPELALAMVRG